MSILLGIAALFGIMFAMFSGAAGGDFSPHRRTRLNLRVRRDSARPDAKAELLLDGEGFEPDSQVRIVAWHLPDGRGGFHREPVESARPLKLRGSYFEEAAFEPAIPLVPYTGDGEPHDIKVIATDGHGNAAEAWIDGKDFYLRKESSVAA
jgi:hypothetical protein